MVESIRNIIAFRKEQIPPIVSPYLFATRTGERPYRGSDVIREYAKKAGVSDPCLFTFTMLRKQIATLSQALQISKWEQDQLATFLGHDICVHRNVYRQPLEVLDKAKVAKILLAANKGVSVELGNNEIEDEELECEVQEDHQAGVEEWESEEEEVCQTKTVRGQNAVAENVFQQRTQKLGEMKEMPKMRPRIKRNPWADEEIRAVKRHLSHCIITGVVPRKDQAMKAVAAEPCLRSRSWRNVKNLCTI
ncbi:hypothetical protein PoB_000475700 [Plakobranchus ocellatus]|uniref:Uncharacterized protein n=1 Tax=Plakobranchus ocellatus TaxID=259542 RepID=A0AAV3Y721_9GAST|nr:hypothetical protein PoB_000475700 [Plakobranchus ocellatus]